MILTNSSEPVVVVVLLHLVVGPGSRDAADVPHQWLVVRPGLVVEAPAVVAEVVEAGLLSTEVRPLLHGAHAAQGVLQVRVNLESENKIRKFAKILNV